jgi:hypothetical protein
VRGVLIEDNVRAGIANFGATLELGESVLRCHDFDLDGEVVAEKQFVFHNLGGNVCGCPEATDTCKLVSAALEPPEALE